MIRIHAVALALVSLLAGRALADSAVPLVSPAAPVPVVHADVAPQEDSASPAHLGLQLLAGAPAGATAQLVLRPVRPLRLELGGAYNGIAPGLVAGVTFAPINFVIAPVIAVSAGRLFEGDATSMVGHFISLDASRGQMVKRLGYDFASAELGLEIGSPDSFVFTLRGGIATLSATLHDAAGTFGIPSTVATLDDATLHATIPCARLGFAVFF